MDKAQSLIQLYRACFYVSMGISILGLLSAVFIFFRFDVRTIFEIRTGRAARRTIRKMAEANAMTGRLRQADLDFTTGGLAVRTAVDAPVAPTAPVAPAPAAAPAAPPAPAAAETAPLRTETASAAVGQTAPLRREQPAPAAPPRPAQECSGFRFTVTQSVMLVHTAEQI